MKDALQSAIVRLTNHPWVDDSFWGHKLKPKSNPYFYGYFILVCMALISAPIQVKFAVSNGISFVSAQAFAKSGSDKDDDHEDKGGDDGKGDDNSGSGGGSDDDGGNSGSGGDDDGGNSGSGSGDDDGGNSGNGSGDDDGDSSGSGGNGGSGRNNAGNHGSGGVVQIEITGQGVIARYSDGSEEKIENGRYERLDSKGRRIERRAASGADIARLRAAAREAGVRSNRSAKGVKARAVQVRISDKSVDITYSNGWSERIRAGRYSLRDPYNRMVAERAATNRDWERLRAVAKQ